MYEANYSSYDPIYNDRRGLLPVDSIEGYFIATG